jgi:hypothetical protein
VIYALRGMGELDRTVTVDPIVVNGQTVDSAGVITGDRPPLVPKSAWPWIIVAAVLGAVWYMSSDDEDDDGQDDDDDEEGGLTDRPFDE